MQTGRGHAILGATPKDIAHVYVFADITHYCGGHYDRLDFITEVRRVGDEWFPGGVHVRRRVDRGVGGEFFNPGDGDPGHAVLYFMCRAGPLCVPFEQGGRHVRIAPGIIGAGRSHAATAGCAGKLRERGIAPFFYCTLLYQASFLLKYNRKNYCQTVVITTIIVRMKALTLWQPYSQAIAIGLKQFETRSWATKHRGLLAIHCSVKPLSKQYKQLAKKYGMIEVKCGL